MRISDWSSDVCSSDLHGNLATLPAGDISTSFRIGAETNDFASRSFRGGMIRDGAVSRDIVNGRLNLDLPITSKRRDVLAFAGDLSANDNVSVDHLSDFGPSSDERRVGKECVSTGRSRWEAAN